MRDEQGQPLGKVYKKNFVPASNAQAKLDIKNDAFTIHETSYNAAREAANEEAVENKRKMIGNVAFSCSAAFDNSLGPDWTKKSHKDRV